MSGRQVAAVVLAWLVLFAGALLAYHAITVGPR